MALALASKPRMTTAFKKIALLTLEALRAGLEELPVRSSYAAGSRLRQRHLRGGAQIRDEITDFVVFEGFQQALGHHGDGGFLAGEDLGFGDDAVLTDEAERELLVVFGGDRAGEGSAIASGDDDELIALLHDLAGVDDLGEDVVKVGAI